MKPILFSTDMVKAILEGRKTVTRRLVKPRYRPEEMSWIVVTEAHSGKFVRCEYLDEYEYETRYMPQPFYMGDTLYVREAWRKDVGRYMYKANYAENERFYRNGKEVQIKWRPSIHMPKEAARIFLRVIDVRVERLKNMSASQAMSEGVNDWNEFIALWNRTIKPADRSAYGWDANPWVWVIEFERCNKEAVG